MHTWDAAVALLVNTLGQLAARTGKPEGSELQIAKRHQTGAAVHYGHRLEGLGGGHL